MAANNTFFLRYRMALSTMIAAPLLMAGALMADTGTALAQQAYAYGGGAQQQQQQQQQQSSPDAQMQVLHDALHLKAGQEASWQVYRMQTALAAQSQGRQMAATRLIPTLDSPHRMALVEAEMRHELSDLYAQGKSLNSFYSTLTPSQRKIFDQRTLPPQQQR